MDILDHPALLWWSSKILATTALSVLKKAGIALRQLDRGLLFCRFESQRPVKYLDFP